jgi:hypothetical protein
MRRGGSARGTAFAGLVAAAVGVAAPALAQDGPVAQGHPDPAPGPPVALDVKQVPIRFVSSTPETDLHVRTRQATFAGAGYGGDWSDPNNGTIRVYHRVCTGPCDATLPAGEHRFALSYQGMAPVEADRALAIDGPATLRGTYEDRGPFRIAGWILFGASVGLGAGMVLAALSQATRDCSGEMVNGGCVVDSSPNKGLLVGGGVVMLVGTLAGVVLGLQRDRATIDVTPAPRP